MSTTSRGVPRGGGGVGRQTPSDPEDTPHQHKADDHGREHQESERIAGTIHELPQPGGGESEPDSDHPGKRQAYQHRHELRSGPPRSIGVLEQQSQQAGDKNAGASISYRTLAFRDLPCGCASSREHHGESAPQYRLGAGVWQLSHQLRSPQSSPKRVWGSRCLSLFPVWPAWAEFRSGGLDQRGNIFQAPEPIADPRGHRRLAPTAAAGAQIVERILPGGIAGERRMLRVDRERIDVADLLTLRLVQGKAGAAKGDADHLLELARLDPTRLRARSRERRRPSISASTLLRRLASSSSISARARWTLGWSASCSIAAARRTGFALADAAGAEPVRDPLGDHAAGRAELTLDDLGLAHQGFEDDVLLALRVLEIPAEDLRRRLELAVDPAVALLQTRRDSTAGRNARGRNSGSAG